MQNVVFCFLNWLPGARKPNKHPPQIGSQLNTLSEANLTPLDANLTPSGCQKNTRFNNPARGRWEEANRPNWVLIWLPRQGIKLASAEQGVNLASTNRFSWFSWFSKFSRLSWGPGFSVPLEPCLQRYLESLFSAFHWSPGFSTVGTVTLKSQVVFIPGMRVP